MFGVIVHVSNTSIMFGQFFFLFLSVESRDQGPNLKQRWFNFHILENKSP